MADTSVNANTDVNRELQALLEEIGIAATSISSVSNSLCKTEMSRQELVGHAGAVTALAEKVGMLVDIAGKKMFPEDSALFHESAHGWISGIEGVKGSAPIN